MNIPGAMATNRAKSCGFPMTTVPVRMRALVLTTWLIAATGALAATPAAATDENEQLFKAIHDFCLVPAGTIKDTARLVMRWPGARDMGAQRAQPYVRVIGFLKLGSGGTVVTQTAATRTAPLTECSFVSYSDDAAELMSWLSSVFDLPEPTRRPIDDVRQVTARRAFRGQAMWIDLQYGLQDNNRAGSFTLTVRR